MTLGRAAGLHVPFDCAVKNMSHYLYSVLGCSRALCITVTSMLHRDTIDSRCTHRHLRKARVKYRPNVF